MNPITEPEMLTEVPEALKKLARYISRGFYNIEHALIIDMLLQMPCMKEEDMLELLKFEQKQLRSLIKTLKNDKFVKERLRVETDAEGRMTRHSYYFINFQVFVNVTKYKLDHMRRKIETDERDSTSRASFKCNLCQKSYTDLEADQLFDMFSGTFKCTFCQTEVEEELSSVPQTDTRTLLARFNEQMAPLYRLLQECEDFKLAPEVLEPEPTDIKHLVRASSSKTSDKTGWSGEAKRATYGYTESQVTISVQDENKPITQDIRPQKEQPLWMRESTVEGAVTEMDSVSNDARKLEQSMDKVLPQNEDEVMRTLLAHEKKGPAPPLASVSLAAAGSGEDTSSDESMEDASIRPPSLATSGPVDEMESEEEEEGVPMVTVAGESVPYDQVDEGMVSRMSEQERDHYIKVGQEMFQNYYL